MTETATPAKTPRHLWVVGVLSLLWNAMGAVDFTMTATRNEAYLKNFTPEQLDYFFKFPLWAMISWGTATWGSLLGSMLLLLRRKLAVTVNLIVIIAMVPTFTYNYIITNGLKVMGGPGVIIFTAVIVIVGVLLYVYARNMARRGVLR
jgi:hypothetical protein